MVDLWPAIHAERKALLTDLDDVPRERWSTPSLCSRWTVKQVFGHVIATAQTTPAKFVAGMLGAGFNFHRFIERDADRFSADSPPQMLAAFRGVQTSTSHPPRPIQTWLGETIVHGEDIRRPLGITRDYPVDAVTAVADFYTGLNMVIGSKGRIAGVTLRATDTDWTHGSGPEAAGRAIDLLLAMTGRPAGVDELTGDGVAVLRSRAG